MTGKVKYRPRWLVKRDEERVARLRREQRRARRNIAVTALVYPMALATWHLASRQMEYTSASGIYIPMIVAGRSGRDLGVIWNGFVPDDSIWWVLGAAYSVLVLGGIVGLKRLSPPEHPSIRKGVPGKFIVPVSLWIAVMIPCAHLTYYTGMREWSEQVGAFAAAASINIFSLIGVLILGSVRAFRGIGAET